AEVHAEAQAEVAAIGAAGILLVCREVAAAKQAVHGTALAEVEARVRTNAGVFDLRVAPAVFGGAVQPTGGHLEADQPDRPGLPAVARADGERILVDAVIDLAPAPLDCQEGPATPFFP